MGKPYLKRPEAAYFLSERGLDIAPATLAKYVTVGGGPLMYKFGSKARYAPGDLLTWAANRMGCPIESLI